MNRVVLAGCRTEPLGSYLQGLGAWRAVVRQADPDARAHWAGGCLVLTTILDADGLIAMFRDRYEPVPVVSPWNAGSGFAGNGKNRTAEDALSAVRASPDPRLARLRAAVLVADEIVAEGRGLGWGASGDELWDKRRKADVIALCRNRLPDDALPWLDAAVVLAQDSDPTYPRLLGTGGNFGRQDLSTTYVQRVLTVLADPKHANHAERWLRAALFADESVPYLRDTVGQFDPGRAGGVQSSPWEKQDDQGFANPWSFLLTAEGALLFASAVVRRQGALSLMARAAVPFQVRVSAVGFGSSASDERALGEIWTPEWDRPARLVEVEHLLGEGRADWNGKPARSGVDFVRAIATLGVDRGITRFTRHVFVERLGQNPLAVPVGQVPVAPRGSVGLLAEVDPWLDRVRGASLPAAVESLLRRVDAALYAVARAGGPDAFREVVVAIGRLHEAVARSGRLRERIHPLVLRSAEGWWSALDPDHAELRVAGGLASNLDDRQGGGPLRLLVSPVNPVGHWLRWTDRPAIVPWGASVVETLAAVHRWRAIPGMVNDPADQPSGIAPAVRGVLSAYRRGITVPDTDVVALATGRLDEDLLGDYLRGLLLLDWRRADPANPRGGQGAPLYPPALSVLLPFFAVEPLRVRLTAEMTESVSLTLRPGEDWIASLRAAGPAHAIGDALRRLRAAGIREALDERAATRTSLNGDRLAAALLLRVAPAARVAALRRVAALPTSSALPEGVLV